MSLFNVFDVAGSAMNAQSLRMNVTASNLANAGRSLCMVRCVESILPPAAQGAAVIAIRLVWPGAGAESYWRV